MRAIFMAMLCLAGLVVAAEPEPSWTETMLKLRATCVARAGKSVAEPATFKPLATAPLRGDGPGQAIAIDVTDVQVLRLITVLDEPDGNIHIWGEARLIARDGTVTPLSKLEPLVARVGWGRMHPDRNWQGQPLQIGERKFENGLWVHADSEVVFALDGKYARFEAWVGADAARPIGSAIFKVEAGAPGWQNEAWRQIVSNFPMQARWFSQDLRGREAEWFAARPTPEIEKTLIAKAIASLAGLAGPFKAELETLTRENAAAGDVRWIDLYARACRIREANARLERVATAQLRLLLNSRLVKLAEAGVKAEDERWTQMDALITAATGDGTILSIHSLRDSMTSLSRLGPGASAAFDELFGELPTLEARWREALAAIESGNEVEARKIAGLQTDLAAFRRRLLFALEGMKAFVESQGAIDLPGEWRVQYESLEHDLRSRGRFAKVAAETYRPESLILESDRDPTDIVLRRTAALLHHLRRDADPPGMADLARQLAFLAEINRDIAPEHSDARFVLFAQACRLRRQMAFANPLLDFDRLLFIKRHRAIFNHMCDQYYGIAARPGGGLYVLSNPFSSNPQLKDLLAEAVVSNGRLKGQKLSGGPKKDWKISYDGVGHLKGETTEGGCFVSPDVSFDGKSILFAYVECVGDRDHRDHTVPSRGHWAEGRCYHIFKVNADGSDLRQLTDGTWNDFDPCFLPNGRIAFITERRGGYLRCGRVCPNYTLYDMAADGSDITALSLHETNEWHPSVTNDGRIIYTRWDYVDRHGCTAHQPWVTTLDGRDSRAVHGNFAPRNARPDMEMDVRAIPGSSRFIATAAPHHGQAYGSLVLIDPHVPDDDAMAPLKRITPDVGFPESQDGTETYGTPWPLSEDYYLCVYDAPSAARKPGHKPNYGIYLVDAFGNKELIYRDPDISCLSPIPLRARPMPAQTPIMASAARNAPGTQQPARIDEATETTISILNIYESRRPWPEGTRIKALRVLQLYPMSVPSGSPPHETGVRIDLAGDSVVTVRHVLGTVPVEEDGSAHLVVPANRELFFQALDEKGLAVQSMRSATYLRGGERLTCAGCHEPAHRAPVAGATPMALRREPSRLAPDVDGSRPFSYPRLVQPVLDRHCVDCHRQNAPKAINLARDPVEHKWFASYRSLTPKFAFTSYGNNIYTTPGQFGARASKLYQLLQQGHYDVKLPDEDMHRLTLWLDCASMFYGVYEKELGEAQLRGEVVQPTLE